MNGMVYNWAIVLADRMEEFMTLQHRTFYMSHHAIRLFLDVELHQIPMDDFEVPPRGRLAAGKRPVFYVCFYTCMLSPNFVIFESPRDDFFFESTR